MNADIRTATVEDLPYLKEGDEVIVGYHQYRVLGAPKPFGVLGDVLVPAARRNSAMPSGWECADLTLYSFR